MNWSEKVIKRNIKELFSTLPLYLLTTALLAAWYFGTGESFHWVWIDPLEVPPYQRVLYGALVFAGPGRLLYKTKIYLVLWWLFDFRTFKEVKAIIWAFLLWLMYFKIIPMVIDLINGVISIGYNIYKFILYVAPAFAISILLMGTYLYLRHKKTRPTVLNTTSEKSL